MIFSDSSYYEGYFSDFLPSGDGVYTKTNGETIIGVWNEGVL